MPEIAEDVSDLIGIVSPYETPLLDAIGDPLRCAKSIHHEWLEDNSRHGNYTQIFKADVEVKSDDFASGQLCLSDEMDYQKQERLRELIRDLENTVINGGRLVGDEAAAKKAKASGSRTDLHEYQKTKQRKMTGIIPQLTTNVFGVGDKDFPAGEDLDEEKINHVLRCIWETSNGNIDLIVVGGIQKRKMNSFASSSRNNDVDETTHRDMVRIYESDFGVCRMIVTRWMPSNAVLLLDSSRVNIMPLAGRSFHFKPLASNEDYECGELIGEYTVELKNEAGHGLISGLSIT